MFRFIGGKNRRPRKSLESCTDSCKEEQEKLEAGELSEEEKGSITQALFDEEANSFFFPDGEPAALMSKSKINELIDLVSVCLMRDSYLPPVDEADILKAIQRLGPPIYPASLILTQKRLAIMEKEQSKLINKWRVNKKAQDSVQARHGDVPEAAE